MLAATSMGDEELVARAVHGDRSALEALVRRHTGTVRAVVLAQLGAHPEVDDIVQETFLGAVQGLPGLREPAKLGAWLRGIARNLSYQYLRRGARGVRTVPLAAQDLAAPEIATGTSAAEDGAHLVHAIAQLPEKLREALVLFYVERLGYAEIGHRLDISAAAVNRRLTRARQQLRERLAGARSEETPYAPR